MTSDTTLTTVTTESKIFRCHLSIGILATEIFRCYLSMTILTISNLRCLTHFFRCHLRMRKKVLLLFKYEFFETLVLSHSQKKVIILQLFLKLEFVAQIVFETQIQIYFATQILNEINFGESKL